MKKKTSLIKEENLYDSCSDVNEEKLSNLFCSNK
jgi:hypothetical protein